jgi:predicted dithiol-disulfide oxidoreductase (DUF899 family)
MANHRTGTRAEFQAASKQIHERQEELGRMAGELAEARREVPWVQVEKDYELETEDGKRSLGDLFDGRSQLLIYHMMFGPTWTAACPGCSSLVDHFDPMLPHLNGRDVTLVCVSRAPIDKLGAYRRRMEWKVDCMSSYNSDFNYDFGASITKEQQPEIAKLVLPMFEGNKQIEQAAESCGIDLVEYVTTEAPGLDSFAKEPDGTIYHTFTSVPWGDLELGFVPYLERAPRPGPEGFNITRHDEYKATPGRRPS